MVHHADKYSGSDFFREKKIIKLYSNKIQYDDIDSAFPAIYIYIYTYICVYVC